MRSFKALSLFVCLMVVASMLWGSYVTSGTNPSSVPPGNKRGNSQVFQLASGGFTDGHALKFDVDGNAVDGGVAPGSHSYVFTVNGAGSAFSTGPIGSASEVETAGTIYKVVMNGTAAASGSAQTACSATIDIWKHAGAVPVSSGDKISASAPATLSSAIQSSDTTLTGWTTSVSSGDYFTGNVASNSTCLSATVQVWWR